MARVFVAHETRLDRKVVIKVLNPGPASVVSAERFEQEIRLAARLQDPRIVPVLGAGETGGLPYYTMPLVDGESLRERMRRGRLPLAESISILRDVALALGHAHETGIVHRDIKPDNILLSRGTAMVTDFGIAKALASSTAAGARETLTQAGLTLGTPAYMAPEQAAGDDVDHRADIYAWGVVAYELLAGEHPFAGRTSSQSMVAAHIADPIPPLATRAPSVPAALAALVERALRKDPSQRPPDAATLVAALEEVATGTPSQRLWVVSVVVAIALVAVVGALVLRPRSAADVPDGGSRYRSVAIMPFVSLGGDTADAYLGEGLADELVTTLALLPDLRVLARRPTPQPGARRLSPQEVGRVLGVHAVLDGTLQRSAGQLRVRATLTRAGDGTVIWSRAYDRNAGDMFGLQDEVATAIAAELRGALTGERAYVPAGVPRGTRDAKAYDLFLRARYAWNRRGERGLRTAIDLFQQALARDSAFARAHAGLAMSYVVLPVFSATIPTDTALARAQRSAARALQFDSSLADAHLAMAYVDKMHWRWNDAARHFDAAATLAPDDATVHHWYGVHLSAVGRVNDAVRELSLARSLDPFLPTIGADGAIALYASRRYAEARAEIQRAFVLDTAKSDTWFVLGMIQLAQGHADSAVRSIETAGQLGSGFELRPFLSAAYRARGDTASANASYGEIQRDYAAGRALAYEMAIAAAAAGDRDAALEAVARIVRDRDPLVTELSFPCDPLFDSLKADPRFARLLEGAGMSVCPASATSR
jgi:serine/threonine-protein kinase